jgi:hypothetical protein
MKTTFTVILLLILTCFAVGQSNQVELEFEKQKGNLTLERLSMGEDASSGYDYLVYKNKGEIVKIREIWSSSSNDNPWAEDYFFKNGFLVLFVRYSLTNKDFREAVKGRSLVLKTVEKLTLSDSKLSNWIEHGKVVPAGDPRWAEKEITILEQGKRQLDNYRFLKENN